VTPSVGGHLHQRLSSESGGNWFGESAWNVSTQEVHAVSARVSASITRRASLTDEPALFLDLSQIRLFASTDTDRYDVKHQGISEIGGKPLHAVFCCKVNERLGRAEAST
jgi:hypothetical protein